MKRALRAVALVLAIVTLGTWLILGAHRGWTRTSVPVKVVDEVTGIEATQYQSGFVPGLDFLGATLAGAGILGGASVFFRNQQPTKENR